MARTGGDITRKKILSVAEKLFSEKGYDGASIQEIADAAHINKALIYYHFKNKQDIINSLFEQTLDEMFSMPCVTQLQPGNSSPEEAIEKRVIELIKLLEKKKKILAVMLMEGLKNDKTGHVSLFECANMIISKNMSETMLNVKENYKDESNHNELLMHEFFTGFLPLVFFALFKDKWADFFKCDRAKMVTMFAKIFKESHIHHD